MGKKKLPIVYVEDPAKRRSHFKRRMRGVFKKVHELAVLCRIPLALIVGDEKKTPHFFRARCGDDDFISAAINTSSLSDKLMLYTPHTGDFHHHNNTNMNMQVYQPPHHGSVSSPAAQGSDGLMPYTPHSGDFQAHGEPSASAHIADDDVQVQDRNRGSSSAGDQGSEWTLAEIEELIMSGDGDEYINPSLNTSAHHALAVGDNSNLNAIDELDEMFFNEAAALLLAGEQSNFDFSAVGEDPRTRMGCWNLDEDQMMLPVPQLVQVYEDNQALVIGDEGMGCNEFITDGRITQVAASGNEKEEDERCPVA